MDGRTRSIVQRGQLSCHCLLVETNSGLALIDTGLGLHDVRDPKGRLSRFFLQLVKPDFREEMTAFRQVERMGFRRSDVRHIILSHLDFDHAGGIDDFPDATVHLLEAERNYAIQQKTWLDRQRFRPQQWASIDRWKVYEPDDGDRWFGFLRVQTLVGLPPEIVLLPLNGHTFGHAGIAIRTDEGRWLLYAGDAYFFHAEMNREHPWCTPGLRLYQAVMQKDRWARLTNQHRLRELVQNYSTEVDLFCAHDISEFERLSGRSADVPAEFLTDLQKSAS